ncbi:MAG: tRNA pseudouridine(55) synthase TruB [Candidatus Krumholzibacteria bacterium]|nr:tRNA pseudouridine(55) synthase TruB [Candidatus Krumholzibacteria bacterium]
MNPFDDKVFVIDKAPGPTSFDVVSDLRRASGLRRVGHAGTLDPLAEGVLLLCTGMATRAVEHLMNLEKTYDFEIRLGVETSTLDAEGHVIREAPVPAYRSVDVQEAAASFVGDYQLVPPPFSAVKRQGRRMYEIARAGEALPEVPPRTVRIYAFDVLAVQIPFVCCRVRCSRGTYVRSLARDLGERLGVPAHVTRLARTRVGSHARDDAFPSDRLARGDAEGLEGIDVADALAFLPAYVLNDRSRQALLNGSLPAATDAVRTNGTVESDAPVRLVDEEGRLIAVGKRRAEGAHNPSFLVDSFRLFIDARAQRPKPAGRQG